MPLKKGRLPVFDAKTTPTPVHQWAGDRCLYKWAGYRGGKGGLVAQDHLKTMLRLLFLFVGYLLFLWGAGQPSLQAQASLLERNFSLRGGTYSNREAVLKDLSEQGASFAYRNDHLGEQRLVLAAATQPLAAWLKSLLAETDLTYELSTDGQRVLIFRDPVLLEGRFNIAGLITDRQSGERLIQANVFIPKQQKGVSANEYGFYSLQANGGQLSVRFTYVGYEEKVIDFVLRRDTLLYVQLKPALALSPIVVTALADSLIGVSPEAGGIQLGITETKQMSGPGGEADPIRLASLLPGIVSGADGLGGLSIRGGESSHNLILLDGVPVYNLNHAAGLFSIFNPQAIKRIDLYKNGLPSRFGGRLSGVIDVHTRDGNLYHNELQLSTSLLASRFTAEGPLLKGESSYLVSGRYFWATNFLPQWSRNYKATLGREGAADYQLYDLNFKLNHQIGLNDRLYFSFYSGLDQLSNASFRQDTITTLGDAGTVFRYAIQQIEETDISWGNGVGALRWNHLFNDRFFGNLSLTYSSLRLRSNFAREESLQEIFFNSASSTYAAGIFNSDIRQLGLAFDGQWHPAAGREWRFGLQANAHDFSPVILTSSTERIALNTEQQYTRYQPKEGVAYTEYVLRQPGMQFRAGLRAHAWRTDQGGVYFNLLPRLFYHRRLGTKWSWQNTFDATAQPVHLLGSAAIEVPTDIWVPSTHNLAPSKSYQLSSSLRYRLLSDWELEVSAYVKRMEDLLLYQGGSNLNGEWESRMSQGMGEAYGIESSLHKRQGKLRGWLSYTYGKTNRTFDAAINLGRSFPYRFDYRHAATAFITWQVGARATLNLNWRYGSGAAYSFSLESYQLPSVGEEFDDPALQLALVSAKNNYRLPANHRLDVNYRFELKRKPDSRVSHTFDLGLYNAYDRHNPIYYELRTNYRSGRGELIADRSFVQIYIAPLLPIFSYEMHFKGK